MKRQLYDLEQVKKFISDGRAMVLSGGEEVLSSLPKGNWIGGTSTYFMNTDKAVVSKQKIFVDDFTDVAENFKISLYSTKNIHEISIDAYENGFTTLILPSDSPVYSDFGFNSLSYDKIFNNPVVGFVAGVIPDEIVNKYETSDGSDKVYDRTKREGDNEVPLPTVFNGQTLEKYHDVGVAMHVELPDNKVARVEILNVEQIDKDSPNITFPKTDFVQSECFIDGERHNIADFLLKEVQRTNYNIVADYNGSIVSRDIKLINPLLREVHFYTAVFDDEVYYLASRIDDYKRMFDRDLEFINKDNVLYSCVCMSCYMRGDLDQRKIDIEGVFGFGEIAYHVLNRTLIYLEIDEI